MKASRFYNPGAFFLSVSDDSSNLWIDATQSRKCTNVYQCNIGNNLRNKSHEQISSYEIYLSFIHHELFRIMTGICPTITITFSKHFLTP